MKKNVVRIVSERVARELFNKYKNDDDYTTIELIKMTLTKNDELKEQVLDSYKRED